MDDSSLIKKRNAVKGVGSLAAIFGAMSSDNTNTLLIDGPGFLTGFLVLITLSCVVYLAKTKG